jgi:hypothetical protein
MATEGTAAQFCSRCGRQRVGDERFCPNDGTPYMADTQPPPAVSAANTAPSPAAPAAPAKKKGGFMRFMGLGCLGLVGLFVLLLVIGNLAGGGSRASATPQAGQEVSGGGAAAPGGAAPAQPAAGGRVAAVGQRVESGGIAITVNSVSRAQSLGQFLRAAEGKTYVVADVTLESPGRDTSPYNPIYFKVRASDGIEYTSTVIGDDRSLKSGELARGDRVRGTVAFEVPTGTTGLVLAYQPLVIFGGYQTIRIGLE